MVAISAAEGSPLTTGRLSEAEELTIGTRRRDSDRRRTSPPPVPLTQDGCHEGSPRFEFSRTEIGRVPGGTAAAVGLILASATSAHATQAQPPTDWSFYITTPNTTTAYNWGCSQGNFDRTHGNVDSENILDFGAQDSAGTKLVNGTYITKAQLEAVVEQWARGYYVCTDGDTTSTNYLAIGTNNSIPSVLTTGYGQA